MTMGNQEKNGPSWSEVDDHGRPFLKEMWKLTPEHPSRGPEPLEIPGEYEGILVDLSEWD